MLCLEQSERGFPLRSAAWHDVADQSLGFHNPDVWLLRDRQQIVGNISADHPFVSPVVRQANLMDDLAFYGERTHARRDQHTRLNLLSPQGAIVSPQTYNRMFSMHGVVMVFFFLVPVIPAVLGNFFIPMMIGAKDLAFPVVNLLSWYVYIVGALVGTLALTAGGVYTRWTFYAPLSTQYAYGQVEWVIVGAFLLLCRGVRVVVRIKRILEQGFQRLVVRGQWTIFESA